MKVLSSFTPHVVLTSMTWITKDCISFLVHTVDVNGIDGKLWYERSKKIILLISNLVNMISFLLWITSLLDIYINGFLVAFQSLTGSLKIFGRVLLQRQISIA